MPYRWIFYITTLSIGVILGIASSELPERYGEMIDDHGVLILVTLAVVVLFVLGWWKRRSDRRAPGETAP